MLYRKITQGFVVQIFDEAGKFVRQRFCTRGGVIFETENDDRINAGDMPLGGGEYQPFEMKNPLPTIKDSDFTFEDLRKCIDGMSDDARESNVTVFIHDECYPVNGFVYGVWDEEATEIANGILDNDHPFLIV